MLPRYPLSLPRLGRRIRLRPNIWDIIALALIFGLFIMFMMTARQSNLPLATVEHSVNSLKPTVLPLYGLRTTLRMLAALAASFVFTIVYASLAAKSRRAELVLIPILDVLQSVPILGYISFTTVFFLSLFPGKELGAELAVTFAIFTGQAWNMTFSFYQSLRTIPADLDEAARAFRFSGWQKFIRLELPFAMPGLIWNMMMSMSGGWFFIVAAEAIKVGDLEIKLPGIGSYLALAIERRDLHAVGWAVLAMTIVIVLYDQLMFRPLVAWADKFRFDTSTGGSIVPDSWFLRLLKRVRLLGTLLRPAKWLFHQSLKLHLRADSIRLPPVLKSPRLGRSIDIVWYIAIALGSIYACLLIYRYVDTELTVHDIAHAATLGLYTLIRVIVLIALATLVWVPTGVYIGLKPRLAEFVQPIAQFLAAFPANLVFPVAVIGILHFHLNADIWLSPLIILGTQWYILFNIVAGMSALPSDLLEAARSFGVKGWLWWRKVILPGLLPYYITGALTATGGAWNASIVAETVSWGSTHIQAHGLGAYIADMTDKADYPRIILGIIVMSLYVILFNRSLWRPLYKLSERRFKLA